MGAAERGWGERAHRAERAFTDFVLQITYPPNPNRPLDNVLTPDQEAGRQLFSTVNCGIPSAPELNGAVLTCTR